MLIEGYQPDGDNSSTELRWDEGAARLHLGGRNGRYPRHGHLSDRPPGVGRSVRRSVGPGVGVGHENTITGRSVRLDHQALSVDLR